MHSVMFYVQAAFMAGTIFIVTGHQHVIAEDEVCW
jgi:hypothetical protein